MRISRIKLLLILLVSLNLYSIGIEGIGSYTGVSISSIDYEGYSYAIGYEPKYSNLYSVNSGFDIYFLNRSDGQFGARFSYMERGGREESSYNETTYKDSHYYFSLGFLYKYIFDLETIDPTIIISPRFDYRFRSRVSLEEYEDYNCGFDMGLGLMKNINESTRISIDLIWSTQLMPIFRDFYKEQWLNNAFMLTVGFNFKFDNKAE